ncbi:MAG: hypothetical protein HF981_12605 [Desulfobacteraceae bacterium]|nr:hypothetical protein [Desulfobacteraceae bacterium]MBC2751220.1 hypothetical protein [Desulfobacteraceae bacterium]
MAWRKGAIRLIYKRSAIVTLYLNHSSAIRYQKVQAEIKDAMVILATGGDVMQIYRMYIEMIAFFLLALAVMAIPAMG